MAMKVEPIGDSIQITFDSSYHHLLSGPCRQVLNLRQTLQLIRLLLATYDSLQQKPDEPERSFESARTSWEWSSASVKKQPG